MHAGTKLIASSNADWVAKKNVQSLTAVVVVVVEVKTTPRRRPQNVMGQKHRTITYLHYICKLLCVKAFLRSAAAKPAVGGGRGAVLGRRLKLPKPPILLLRKDSSFVVCVCVVCVYRRVL